MKVTFHAIFEGPFKKKLEKISREVSRKETYVSVEEFLDFCRPMKRMDFSLSKIFNLINYKVGSETERALKRMFYEFFVWFLGNRYTAFVLKSDQCENKTLYLQGKNQMKYLLTIK